MRASIAILVLLCVAPVARAQDAGPPDAGVAAARPAEGPPAEAVPAEAPPAEVVPAEAPATPAQPRDEAAEEPGVPLRTAPKVAVVVVGDPDPILVAAAREIEARLAIAADVRLPADAALRGAMHGDAGADGDGLEEIRGDRRRLGSGEATDAPVLQRLGRRAGAVTVIAIRATEQGPEAVALDVRTAQFFEGTLPLGAPDPAAITTFVARRARTSARTAAAAGPAASEAARTEGGAPTPAQVADGATQPAGEDDGQSPGEWMEQNWPYFAAGALLVAAIVFVAVTATQGDAPPPMLRFQPGTP